MEARGADPGIRYQTTVPESVRRALQLGKRDKIRYTIRPDGAVVLTRANATKRLAAIARLAFAVIPADPRVIVYACARACA